MLISAREAAQILAPSGLTRERARRLLLAGFAGEGLRTRGSLLYDDGRVRALLQRPVVDPRQLPGNFRHGVFVARVMDLGPDLAPGDLTRGLSARTWRLSPYARVEMRIAIESQGYLPFVATVCGFVAVGADIAAVWPLRGEPGSRERPVSTLDLVEPGDWFEVFRGARFPTGAGGPWTLWRPPRPVPLQE